MFQKIFKISNPKITFRKSEIIILKIMRLYLKFIEVQEEEVCPKFINDF